MAADKIQTLLDSVDMCDARLVSVVDEVLENLVVQKLAYTCKLPPKVVGVHPCNRNGYGVSGHEVHALGSKITTMGWSNQACAHAVCAEDKSGEASKFTAKLIAESPGLGNVSRDEVHYGSLACSHTNQFLVAALCGVPTDHENLAVEGRMNVNKLSNDVLLKAALEQGLTWLVITDVAVQKYPRLCKLVQAARNTTGTAFQRESSFQIMINVHNMAVDMSKFNKGVVNWDRIMRTVIKMSMAPADEVSSLIKFVQKFGGGEGGRFVFELMDFHKMHVPAGRVVPRSTFQQLADLKLAPGELCPWFVAAVIKAQASCGRDKVCNGVCRYITTADINSLNGPRKAAMKDAEQVLQECRALARNHGIQGPSAVKCFGQLDTYVAKLVLQKKDDTFATVKDAAKAFVDDLVKECGLPAAAVPESPESPVGQMPNFVQYSEEGVAMAPELIALQAQGFKVGTYVKNHTGDKIFSIVGISDAAAITLQEQMVNGNAGKLSTIDYEKFAQEFSVTNSTIEIVRDWVDRAPSKQSSHIESVMKAFIVTALNFMANTDAKLRIQLKPVRSVFVEEHIKPQQLVLVPETTKLSLITDSIDNASLFDCTVKSGGTKYTFALSPCFGNTFVCPAWAVRHTDNEDEATVVVVKKTVSTTMGLAKQPYKNTVEVTVSVLTNTKKLNAGDESFVFRRAVAKGTKRTPALSLDPKVNAKAKAKARAAA